MAEYIGSENYPTGLQEQITVGFQQSVTDFLQLIPGDPAIRTAFHEVGRGKWGFINATGIEWPADAADNGPQQVKLDISWPISVPGIAEVAFYDDKAHQDQLIASGEPFMLTKEDGRGELWHQVDSPTGPWPMYRIFNVPQQLSEGDHEVFAVRYALLPHLQLPNNTTL